jgi:hypothetical protein
MSQTTPEGASSRSVVDAGATRFLLILTTTQPLDIIDSVRDDIPQEVGGGPRSLLMLFSIDRILTSIYI